MRMARWTMLVVRLRRGFSVISLDPSFLLVSCKNTYFLLIFEVSKFLTSDRMIGGWTVMDVESLRSEQASSSPNHQQEPPMAGSSQNFISGLASSSNDISPSLSRLSHPPCALWNDHDPSLLFDGVHCSFSVFCCRFKVTEPAISEVSVSPGEHIGDMWTYNNRHPLLSISSCEK